jgi:hypothetical protein
MSDKCTIASFPSTRLGMAKIETRSNVRVADEVWIAVASLHRRKPAEVDFSVEEIMQEVDALRVNGDVRPGVYVHVIQHCVANRPANPANHRMLFETVSGRRRLFRLGDTPHADRLNGRVTPTASDIPARYQDLLDWYKSWIKQARDGETDGDDPLLSLRGSGKYLWADEHADEYVRRLREGWS